MLAILIKPLPSPSKVNLLPPHRHILLYTSIGSLVALGAAATTAAIVLERKNNKGEGDKGAKAKPKATTEKVSYASFLHDPA